jgi:hypothetical protein
MGRFRRVMFAVVVLGLVLAACSDSDDGASDASGADVTAQAAGGDSGGDCSLLSDAEIEEITGVAPVSSEPAIIGRGCDWNDDEDSVTLVSVEIADDATTVGGEPASRYESTFARLDRSSVVIASTSGYGDDAALAGEPVANQIIVLTGDTYVEVLISDVDDLPEGAVEELATLVLDRM